MSSSQALEGILVLEFGMVMQVPLAAQMLGDYGAEVIKIERPDGDLMRYLDTFLEDTDGIGTYYTAVGRNKRVIGIDVKSASGRDAAMRLVDRADVILHNFRPGVMEKLGFGYEELSKRNPRLIYAVGYGFGEKGPMAELPGQDLLAQAYSGFAMSGVEDGDQPKFSNSPIIDYTTAATLTQGILAALMERSRSGKGQIVSTSLLDVALNMQMIEVAGASIRDIRASWIRQSMLFKVRDGWIMVLTLFRSNPLHLLCKAFGLEDLSRHPDYDTRDKQLERLADIQNKFVPVFAAETVDGCSRRLAGVDILFSPVNRVEESLTSEQIQTNGTVWDIQISKDRKVPLAGNPVKLSRTPPQLSRAPAKLGTHTDEVLLEIGFSEAEIGAMRKAGQAY